MVHSERQSVSWGRSPLVGEKAFSFVLLSLLVFLLLCRLGDAVTGR